MERSGRCTDELTDASDLVRVGDLDRTPANFQPLTPLQFLERSAAVYPDHTAIIHGTLRRNYRDFYARARRLASALTKRGIGKNDTVSVVLANTPAMLEAHYGVPMAGAVLNSINTRLDAAIKLDPLAVAPYIDAERVFMILTRTDAIIPFEAQQRLRTELGSPEALYLLTGHRPSVVFFPKLRNAAFEFFSRRFGLAQVANN